MPVNLIEHFIVQCDHCQDRLNTSASPDVDFTVFSTIREALDALPAARWERAPGVSGYLIACPDCQAELKRLDDAPAAELSGPISALPAGENCAKERK